MSTRRPPSRAAAVALANAMLVMYFLSVTASVGIALVIGHFSVDVTSHRLLHRAVLQYAPYYDLPVSLLEFLFIVLYERPIRRLIGDRRRGRPTPPPGIERARRRLLNEPFVLMGLNLVTWIGAAVVYRLLARDLILPPEVATELVVQSLLTAVISVLATFFLQQYCIQRWLAPVLFPDGGLSRVRGVVHVRISARLAALMSAACLAPLLIIGVTLYGAYRQRLYGIHPDAVLDRFIATIGAELVLFSLAAAGLTLLVAANLSRPFRDILDVLHQIKRGRFDRRVRVVTSDEIGYTGDAINDMAAGLQERERMRRSLWLAREVQQSLLPAAAPRVPGLDVAGRSMYCDETGGDYFDFVQVDRNGRPHLAAVVGDVSGHGVSAALVMTSLRALLRYQLQLPGGQWPPQLVGQLNCQICGDNEDTGHFVTLFYLEVDPGSRELVWVRAGHEPACLYRVRRDRLEFLDGPGTALGIDPGASYADHRGVADSGDVLLLTTDGIFETRRGTELFGRRRLAEVVRASHRLDAAGIMAEVLGAVSDFRGQAPQEDDVTLVVIKFQ